MCGYVALCAVCARVYASDWLAYLHPVDRAGGRIIFDNEATTDGVAKPVVLFSVYLSLYQSPWSGLPN
jgi:hypothetical protein